MNEPVIENGLTVRCGVCDEDLRWSGKPRRKVCGCTPIAAEPTGRRKCSPKGAKQKGDGEERAICKAFESWGYVAYRTAGSGAHGSRNNEQAFATDVRVKLGGDVWKVESKRHASVAGVKTLLKLMDGSDILWVRQDFEGALVFMTAETFGRFAALAAEAAK